MATKTVCDICGSEQAPFFKVVTPVGEHPHVGANLMQTLDYCLDCLGHVDLETELSQQGQIERSKNRVKRPEILAGEN